MASEKSVMVVIRASRPSFRNSHDKVAFVVHASFLAAGYVLTATGRSAFADDVLSASFTDEVGLEGWNEVEDEYAFLYVNPEKGNKKVLVKCLVWGEKLMVDALSDGGSGPVHAEINADEFVPETGASDYNSQYKNLGKLVSHLDSEILSKLDGSAGSHSGGPSRFRVSEEPNSSRSDESGSPQNSSSVSILHPVAPVGGDDLFPSAGAGMFPTRGGYGGGSMLIGPEDPRWFGGGGDFSHIPGGLGGLAVPPGARFDPYGPPGVPGFEPGRFGRFPRGPSPGGVPHPDFQPGSGRPGGRTHPDLEQPGSGGFDYI